MKFVYDKPNRRIVSNDPNVWVDFCGPERERGLGFVLHWNGEQVGFREPDSRTEMVPNSDNTKHDWTIGEVGGNVKGWDESANEEVYKAVHRKFRSRDELEQVLSLVRDAMGVFSGRHEQWDPKAIEVHFSEALKTKIASGELFDD